MKKFLLNVLVINIFCLLLISSVGIIQHDSEFKSPQFDNTKIEFKLSEILKDVKMNYEKIETLVNWLSHKIEEKANDYFIRSVQILITSGVEKIEHSFKI